MTPADDSRPARLPPPPCRGSAARRVPRPATPADETAVRAVTDAAYHPYIARTGPRPAPMDRDHGADVAAGRVFVTGDPVIGLVVLVPHMDHLYLESIAAHPDAHGGGVGRDLLGFGEQRAQALGLPEVRLLTHAFRWENQRIYAPYGYEVVARRKDGAFDRVHYRKPLTD